MSKLFSAVGGLDIYLVGGGVRDQLMGLGAKDFDFVVVGSTPDTMLGLGFKQVGADFPVFLHPESGDEYALARTERKSGKGYHGFTVQASPDVTLVEDLGRRDLTINSIAMAADGQLVDPYGGVQDIQRKVLKHVSASAFVEDPVRVMRLARFAARYTDFTVDPETMDLARAVVASGEMSHLVAERVWAELAKGLMESKPSRMFDVLRQCGALAVLIPELNKLWGVIQKPEHHPEVDAGIHTMMAVDYAAKRGFDLDVRFAVLVHDLGKGITPVEMLPAHISHDVNGVPLVTDVALRLKVPSAMREMAEIVCAEHINIHGCKQRRMSSVVKLLMRLDAFRRPDRLVKMLQACESDARGRLGLEDREYTQPQYLLTALAAARSVNVAAVVSKCSKREFLQDQILNARTGAVRAALSAFSVDQATSVDC